MFDLSPIQINQIALGLFLLVTLYLGLRVSGGIKTMRDYALANQSLGGGVLVITLVATIIGAGDLLNIKIVYVRGVSELMFISSFSMMTFLLGWFVFPKLTAFKKHYTLGAVVGELYGRTAQIITILIATVFSLLVIIGQLRALAEVGGLLGGNRTVLISLLGTIITLYTCIGGIRSVAITDMLQFAFLALGIVLFTTMSLNLAGGVSAILAQIPEDSIRLQFWSHPNFARKFLSACLWAICPTLLLAPPVIQRALMTTKRSEVRHMFVAQTLLYAVFHLLILLIGFSLLAIKTMPSLEEFNIGSIIQVVSSNAYIQSILLLSFIAIMMSTMDSSLNALAVLWANDILGSKTSIEGQSRNTLIWARYITLFCGLFCTLCALFVVIPYDDIIGYALMSFSVICLPFIMGLLGLKGNGKIFLYTIGSFFITFLLLIAINSKQSIGYFLMNIPISSYASQRAFYSARDVVRLSWLFSLFVSSVVFFATHYLEYGRFVFVDREQDVWKEGKSYKIGLPSFRWLREPLAWAGEQVAAAGDLSYLFGLFTYITCMVPYITASDDMQVTLIAAALRGGAFVLCTLLLLKSAWPTWLARYFDLYYLLTILYCVPFTHTLLSLNDPHGLFTILNIVLGMILLTVLLPWRAFLLLQGMGTLMACLVQRLWQGQLLPSSSGYSCWALFFSVAYTLLICLLFARKKQKDSQQHTQRLSNDADTHKGAFATSMDAQQQLTDSLDKRSSMMQAITKAVRRLKRQGAKEEELTVITHAVKHLQQMASKAQGYLPLMPKSFSFTSLMRSVYKTLQQEGINLNEAGITIAQRSEATTLVADPSYLEELITGNLRYLIAQREAGQTIMLAVEDALLDYKIPEDANHSQQPAIRFAFSLGVELPALQPRYHPTSAMPETPAPLTHYARIAVAHYGFVALSADTQAYVLPVDVKAIRPKIGRFSDEDLLKDTEVDGVEDQAFLKAAAQKKGWEMERISYALQLCKHYHRHQKRKSGELFYLHPLAVASIAMPYTEDERVVLASLLHDLVEDTSYTLPQLIAAFGKDVADMVDEVTHLFSHGERKVKLKKKASLVALFKQARKASLLVKLCDRVHNMRTIAGHPSPAKRRAIAEETRDFFVPAAQELKLKEIETELKQRVGDILDGTKKG